MCSDMIARVSAVASSRQHRGEILASHSPGSEAPTNLSKCLCNFSLTGTLQSGEPGGHVKNLRAARIGQALEHLGAHILRYSLVFLLLFFGAMKWPVDEARGIDPLISNSPFLSWAHHLFGVQGASEFIGVIELGIAVLIALRHWKPLLSAWGSVSAIAMFLVTLSFLVTTPNVQSSAPFLLKDLSLLGASLWTAGEALKSRTSNNGVLNQPVGCRCTEK